ncbi:hypothetical protein [Streptomyces griseus]|uniref:hypothetical protein n=1 Tax=Streptomyces griseus TaxID=1911 RepID=UPI0005661BBF|nr:hypothetical protein [Streptomyces griseus]
MPEETTTATAPTPAPTRPTAAQAVGIGCAALIAVPLLLVLGLVVWIALETKEPSDFPRVAPEEMTSRVLDRSQEAYDVLGFTRTISPGVEKVGVSPENTLDADYCYAGGMSDTIVHGVYSMSHSWALDHVGAEQAVPGLRRLRAHLEDTGWDITSYREAVSGDYWDLYASRSDGEERMSFQWFADREYFTGGAAMPCATDPGWQQGDDEPAGNAPVPPDFGPSLRGGTAKKG